MKLDYDETKDADQLESQNSLNFNEYMERIDQQTASYNSEKTNTDYFQLFLQNELGITDFNCIEDRSIYVLDELTAIDKHYLAMFEAGVRDIFENNYTVTFQEPDIFILYCLYKIIKLNFSDYFVYFINGLQKLDINFISDIPFYNELSIKYFFEHVCDKKNKDSIQRAKEYIDYILSFDFTFDNFIEVALLECEGNVELSTLYIELANLKISVDNNFLYTKLKKSISSFIIDDTTDKVSSTIIDVISKKI